MSKPVSGVLKIPVNESRREELPIYKDSRYLRLVKKYKCNWHLAPSTTFLLFTILVLQTKSIVKESTMLVSRISFYRKLRSGKSINSWECALTCCYDVRRLLLNLFRGVLGFFAQGWLFFFASSHSLTPWCYKIWIIISGIYIARLYVFCLNEQTSLEVKFSHCIRIEMPNFCPLELLHRRYTSSRHRCSCQWHHIWRFMETLSLNSSRKRSDSGWQAVLWNYQECDHPRQPLSLSTSQQRQRND